MYDRNPVMINCSLSYRVGLNDVECTLHICVCIKIMEMSGLEYQVCTGSWLEKFDLCFYTY